MGALILILETRREMDTDEELLCDLLIALLSSARISVQNLQIIACSAGWGEGHATRACGRSFGWSVSKLDLFAFE
jgi:hypothetical protein